MLCHWTVLLTSLVQSPNGEVQTLDDFSEAEIPITNGDGAFDIDSLLPTTVSQLSNHFFHNIQLSFHVDLPPESCIHCAAYHSKGEYTET